MSSDYVPRQQVRLLSWAKNFSHLLSATPEHYGVSAGAAAALAAAVDAFAAALEAARNPGTRTPVAVALKNERRAEMIELLRRHGRLIKYNDAVSNDDRVSLGLGVRDRTPTRVPVPASIPILNVTPLPGKTLRFTFRDRNTPESRAKPRGAIGLQLYYFVGETPPENPQMCPLQRFCSRHVFTLNFDAPDVGKKVSVWGRWQTGRGLTGAFSELLVTTVPS